MPLPFADAFPLSALISADPKDGLAREIERPFVVDTVIPGFVYGTDPASPRFAPGELGNQATLSDLLAPVNAARNHVGDLLLHLREDIEEMAQAQGRAAGAVWAEAVAKARKAEPSA